MSTPQRSLPALLLLLAAAAVTAENVQFSQCPSLLLDGVGRNCTVHGVSFSPCAEAASDLPCKIEKRQTGTFSYTFTPDVSTGQLYSRVYWNTAMGDVPVLGMNSNGCDFTSCPLAAGQQATYTQSLYISNKYPARRYNMKFSLLENSGEIKKFECCSIITIEIVDEGTN